MSEIAMIVCRHCGWENPEEAAFCTNCGRGLGRGRPVESSDSNGRFRALGATQTTPEPSATTPAPVKEPAKPKSKHSAPTLLDFRMPAEMMVELAKLRTESPKKIEPPEVEEAVEPVEGATEPVEEPSEPVEEPLVEAVEVSEVEAFFGEPAEIATEDLNNTDNVAVDDLPVRQALVEKDAESLEEVALPPNEEEKKAANGLLEAPTGLLEAPLSLDDLPPIADGPPESVEPGMDSIVDSPDTALRAVVESFPPESDADDPPVVLKADVVSLPPGLVESVPPDSASPTPEGRSFDDLAEAVIAATPQELEGPFDTADVQAALESDGEVLLGPVENELDGEELDEALLESMDGELLQTTELEALVIADIQPKQPSEAGRKVPPPIPQAVARFLLRPLSRSLPENYLIPLGTTDVVIGRNDGTVQIADDPYMSPRHARFGLEGDVLYVEDLESLNGVWLRVRREAALYPGDELKVGNQILRLEKYVSQEKQKEAGATLRMGGAVRTHFRLIQIGADGETLNVHHIAEDGCRIGRHVADLVFTSDTYLSGTHAVLQPRGDHVLVRDLSSRNGSWTRIRQKQWLEVGDAISVGQAVWRVSLPVG